jgi:protein phosphatase
MDRGPAEFVLSELQPLIDVDPAQLGVTVPVPRFPLPLISRLLQSYAAILTHGRATPLLVLTGGLHVVGDLHGDLHDLLRILKSAQLPPASRFLFLGDYVDRGAFSLEIVTFLVALKVLFPGDIYFLRGNHEFPNGNAGSQLLYEIQAQSPESRLWDEIQFLFSFFPLAAIVGDVYFCVHAGIGPHTMDLTEIHTFTLPVATCTSPLLYELLWSDPSPDIDEFGPSPRGPDANLYGGIAVGNFLREGSLKKLIRGHQFVPKGVLYSLDNRVITVSSSSNYGDEPRSQAAFLFIDRDETIIEHHFDPVIRISRESCWFRPVTADILKASIPKPVGAVIHDSILAKRLQQDAAKLAGPGKFTRATSFHVMGGTKMARRFSTSDPGLVPRQISMPAQSFVEALPGSKQPLSP